MNNILIIEGRRTIGGGQVMTRQICYALKSLFNINVFIPDGDSDISIYLKEFSQYKFSMIEYSRGNKTFIDVLRFVLNFINGVNTLRKCIHEKNISLLYVQTSSLIPVAVIVAKIFNINVICHLHVYHIDSKSRKLLNFFLSFSNVKSIIGVSEYTLSQLTEVNRNKSVVLYNCVDVNSIKHVLSNSENYTISILADVVESKGQHILLEAVDRLNFPITVNIIGNIINEEYLNSLKSISKSQNINFIGHVSNVDEWLNKTDIVIVPSLLLFETFSLAMVEAWSKGIPTIASNLGGMKELVESFLPQHQNNMLFEAGNSNQLSDKISKLLSDLELYNRISNDVQVKYKERFTKDSFYIQIRSLLHQYTV